MTCEVQPAQAFEGTMSPHTRIAKSAQGKRDTDRPRAGKFISTRLSQSARIPASRRCVCKGDAQKPLDLREITQDQRIIQEKKKWMSPHDLRKMGNPG